MNYVEYEEWQAEKEWELASQYCNEIEPEWRTEEEIKQDAATKLRSIAYSLEDVFDILSEEQQLSNGHCIYEAIKVLRAQASRIEPVKHVHTGSCYDDGEIPF